MIRRYYLMQVRLLSEVGQDGRIDLEIYRTDGAVGRTRVRRARVYWYRRLVELMVPMPTKWVREDGVGEVVMFEEGEAGVVMFEEGEEERVDVVFLLAELLHEVRGLREEVAGLRAERKPRTIIVSGIDPAWAVSVGGHVVGRWP